MTISMFSLGMSIFLKGLSSSNWAVAVQNIEEKSSKLSSRPNRWRQESMSDAEEGEAFPEQVINFSRTSNW